jgi:hypothetical protein
MQMQRPLIHRREDAIEDERIEVQIAVGGETSRTSEAK